MYADVPSKDIWTFYTLIGDLLACLFIPVFVLFVGNDSIAALG